MRTRTIIYRLIFIVIGLVVGVMGVEAQVAVSPCPEVHIVQRTDHVVNPHYRAQGWDTAITCAQHAMELTAEPYIPVQFFNGTYLVEEIAYAPADVTFSQGTKMPISTDDDFSASATVIPFPFYFFGIRKEGFRLGANGMVTFAVEEFGGGNACPYAFSAAIPWPNGKSGAPSTYYEGTGYVPLARMRDAIYGIYEDTHPIAGYLSGTQGIYYGIQDTFPCRKIVCSWNGIPVFPGASNLNNRCTYQIVCYEGSNIIEVHVKRRGVNTNWQNGVGIIGIQNATGLPQVPSEEVGASNRYIDTTNGRPPAAFWPAGRNTFNTPLDSVAYRFTPLGRTNVTSTWYRFLQTESGEDTLVALTTNAEDTNGHFIAMGLDEEHPTMARAFVSPTCVSRYMLMVNFMNAAGDWYHLSDTITIGIDTVNTLMLKALSGGRHSGERRKFDICRGQTADVRVEYSDIQYPEWVQWHVFQRRNGVLVPLADSCYTLMNDGQLLRLPPLAGTDTLGNHTVDTLFFRASVDFVSGCTNHDSLLLYIHPTYDTTVSEGICKGESYTWALNGQTYSQSTTAPRVTLATGMGCDSVVRLDLKVYDISHTTDRINDCRPITWIDGQTYTADNNTATMTLQNQYGCDSVIHLDYTLHPMTARIGADREFFDYDHLDVELTDLTEGNEGRRWLLTTGVWSTAPVAYYTLPVDLDEADIRLVAFSPYGCTDTARVVIPLRRENLWMPNVFTPDDPDRNNRFGAVSQNVVQMEMYIYNRYGQLVYHCEEVDCQWDGTDLQGNRCREGAYAYIIRYTDVHEPRTTKVRKGTVTVVR